MVILKLKLPVETVHYNKLGKLTSAPVPFVPNSIKGTQMDLEVTGYVADVDFFAFKLHSPDRALTTKEQFSLLSRLGFKAVPIQYYPQTPGTVDVLIRQKARYAQYEPVWWNTNTDSEYTTPKLTTIQDINWTVDASGRLVRRLTTDLGQFDVIDHRAPEYYQVGLQVKVVDGTVQPYMTGTILDPVPTHCPKCNNPLKKMQLASDLPLILKCKSPICKKLKWDDPSLNKPAEATENSSNKEDSFREAAVNPVETSDVTQVQPDALEVENHKLKIVNLEVDLSESILDKVDVISEDEINQGAVADYIVTRSRRSVTKHSRSLSRTSNIPLISIDELEVQING